MNYFQLSIIFSLLQIFAAAPSNGSLFFSFNYQGFVRPKCIDRLKIVYFAHENLEFNERFSTFFDHDLPHEFIKQCEIVEINVRFDANNFNEMQARAKSESVPAMILKDQIIFYRNNYDQEENVYHINIDDFVPVKYIERLSDPCWEPSSPSAIAPPPAAAAASSRLPSTSTSRYSNFSKSTLIIKNPTHVPLVLVQPSSSKNKDEECEGLPLWVYIVLGFLVLFFILASAAAVISGYVWFQLRKRLNSLKNARNSESGSVVSIRPSTATKKSGKSNSFSDRKTSADKNGTKESVSKPTATNELKNAGVKSGKDKKQLPRPPPSSVNKSNAEIHPLSASNKGKSQDTKNKSDGTHRISITKTTGSNDGKSQDGKTESRDQTFDDQDTTGDSVVKA